MIEAGSRHIAVCGEVVADYEVAEGYAECTTLITSRLKWSDGAWSSAPLSVFKVPNVVVTSAYTAIDVDQNRYFLNQTYADVQHFFGLLPKLDGSAFAFEGDVNVWPGPHVVIGGPIDMVWHHWLIQWSARLMVLRRLRPDLMDDPNVRFLVDYRAYEEPFRTLFSAFGIPDHRLTLVDHATSHQLPEGYLVSFLDQNYYYPELMDDYVREVRRNLNIYPDPAGKPIRLFCSRQGFSMPKRRVENFAEIEPILLDHGFTIVELGSLSAHEQFTLFSQAEIVMGMHGADLAGLLFCPRGAQLLLMENERNLATGLAGTYRTLAELRGLRHRTMVVQEVVEAETDYKDFGPLHNRDYRIDPAALLGHLAALEMA